MNLLKKTLHFGALFYAFLCFLEAFYLPPKYSLTIDNYFFILGFLHLIFVVFENKKVRVFVGLFLFLFAFGFIRENYSNILHPSISDLFYFLKLPILMLSLLGPLTSNFKSENILKFVDLTFLILVGINVIELINPFDIGEFVQNIYTPKEYTNFIYYHEVGTYRLAGTCMSPNDNAAIFGFYILYFFLFRGLKYWYYILLAVLILLLTQSRTVFLGLIIMGAIYTFLKNKKHIHKILTKKYLILASSVFLGIVCMLSFSTNLKSLFTGDAFRSHSIMVRYDNLMTSLGESGADKYLGIGMVDASVTKFGLYIDSEFIAILVQFGWIGISIWLILFLYAVLIFSKKVICENFVKLIFIFALIVDTTNYVFLHSQTGVIFAFFIAVTLLYDANFSITTPKNNPATR